LARFIKLDWLDQEGWLLAHWKLEDAKNQFSKLVRAARRQPQVVTRHGREEVVVMSVKKYRELAGRELGLVELVSNSPLADALASGELQLRRTRDLPRDVDL
jgi:prevent-host-death family protein